MGCAAASRSTGMPVRIASSVSLGMRKLGVGVLGVGRLGRRHAENLRNRIPGAQLVAVADTDRTVAMQVAEDLEIEHSYATVDNLLERKDVQAIVIATTSKFHAEAIQAAAQAARAW